MRKAISLMIGAAMVLTVSIVTYHSFSPDQEQPTSKGERNVFDPRQQASQFIAHYHSIPLTPEQEEIKKRALSEMPAPCCQDFSIATCCCPCNLAKSVWGLSHFLIVKRGYNAQKVKEAVEKWIQYTNEKGYAGNACSKGRCNQPFEKDGCGGMNENRIS